MYERFLILLLTSIATLLLAGVVWSRNSSQPVNRYFAFFALSGGAWIISNGLVTVYADTHWGIVWARAAFVSASVIPAAFFLFVSVFPVPKPAISPSVRRLYFLSGFLAALASLTPFVAQKTSIVDGALHMTYGPLHPIFGVYIVSAFAYSLLVLYKKLSLLSGIERLRVRYVFLAVSIPLFGGTVTNLVIPVVFSSSRFNQYGPLFSIPMIAIIAHAIIRYRLMNTQLVIRRSVAYLLTAGIFTILLTLASGFFVSRPQDLPLPVEVGLVVLIAIAFQPIQRNVQAWLDRYFFRGKYDYQRTLREISRTMAGILNLQPLLAYACEAISRTVQPEHVTVYTFDSGTATYKRLITQSAIPSIEPPPDEIISSSSALIGYLSSERRVILAHEAQKHPSARTTSLSREIERLRGDIILPLVQESEITGFFLVGRKLSADPYFAEDIDLLTTLVSQATIALKNAQLYSQVVLANEYVENILTTIESGVIAVDAKGQVALFNPAAERITGLAAHAVKFSSLNIFPTALADVLQDTLYDNLPRTQVEIAIHTGPGQPTLLLCSTSPLRDRTGSMLGAVAVFSDLTRLKTLESEKRQAERLASVGALASGIAHEIKNPLVAIKTFAELLPERFSEDDFRNDFAKVVITEIERIDHLVARLRGLATASSHTEIALDIRAPIEETLALLRGQLEQARITVELDVYREPPIIAGDLAQLKQLFLNLLMNAVEAMEPGGHITIRVGLRGTSRDQAVHVDVIDTGSGIPESVLSRIFDPFVTTKPKGSGLGLSICRGIVDAHKGRIRAYNNDLARGATISLEFPVSLQSIAPPNVTA